MVDGDVLFRQLQSSGLSWSPGIGQPRQGRPRGEVGEKEEQKPDGRLLCNQLTNPVPTPAVVIGERTTMRRRWGGGEWEVWIPPTLRPFARRGWHLTTEGSTPKTAVAAAEQRQ